MLLLNASETPPTCTKNETLSPCSSDMCQNKGTCLTSGENFNCHCLPGYKG